MKHTSFRRPILSVVIVAAFVVGGLFLSHTVLALTVSPPIAEIKLVPGVETKTVIKLYNETEETLTLYTEVVGWGAQDETGIPAFDLTGEKIGLPAWISITPGPFQMEAKQNFELTATISVPSNATPGGHYAAIFISENAPEATGAGNVAIGAKTTSLMLGTVEGDIAYEGRIRSLATSKKVFNRLPVDFLIQFENTGNIHLRPTGALQISNMFGRTSGSADVNVTKSAVLPQQIREYVAVWETSVVDDMNTSGWSGFWNEFSNEWDNFGLGRYTAKAAISSETEDGFTSHAGTTTFWVISWRVLLVFGIGLLFLLFVLFAVITRYNRWIIKKAGEHVEHEKSKKNKQQ